MSFEFKPVMKAAALVENGAQLDGQRVWNERQQVIHLFREADSETELGRNDDAEDLSHQAQDRFAALLARVQRDQTFDVPTIVCWVELDRPHLSRDFWNATAQFVVGQNVSVRDVSNLYEHGMYDEARQLFWRALPSVVTRRIFDIRDVIALCLSVMFYKDEDLPSYPAELPDLHHEARALFYATKEFTANPPLDKYLISQLYQRGLQEEARILEENLAQGIFLPRAIL